jgi:hypothetical protein
MNTKQRKYVFNNFINTNKKNKPLKCLEMRDRPELKPVTRDDIGKAV